MAKKKENPNELDILNEGRKTLAVTFKDGSKGAVTVKKVGLVDMERLAKARRDDSQLLSLYIESEDAPGIASKLSDESILDVLNEGDAVNDPLLNRWLKRQEKKLNDLGISLAELHAAVIKKVTESESETSSTSSLMPDMEPSTK